MNLVLVGFMGAGKSTTGERVAQLLGVPFVDVDRRIEDIAASTVTELFREFGEAGFRSFEAAAIGRTLAEPGQVVAVGGGAVMIDHNWDRIRSGNVVVRLAVSDDEMLERLGDGGGRPLAAGDIGDPAAVQARLVQLSREREHRYQEAPFQVDTTARSVDEVTAEVVAIARQAGFPPEAV